MRTLRIVGLGVVDFSAIYFTYLQIVIIPLELGYAGTRLRVCKLAFVIIKDIVTGSTTLINLWNPVIA
jgi:hypothetical protein